jgi:hypothetical protein
VPSSVTRPEVSSLRDPGSSDAAVWPRRFSDRPLKSAIRKLTSRASSISSSAAAIASTTPTGAAASARVKSERRSRRRGWSMGAAYARAAIAV